MKYENIIPLVDGNNNVVQLTVTLVAESEGTEGRGKINRIIPEEDRKNINDWKQSDTDKVCSFLSEEFGDDVIKGIENKKNRPQPAQFNLEAK